MSIFAAVALPSLIGLSALATEAAYWYFVRADAQSAADMAAISGALAGGSTAAANARSIAGQNGYVDGANSTTVTVNIPPLSGGYTANSSAVEVIVQRTHSLLLAKALLSGPVTLKGRAVAVAGASYCVLALDPTASGSVNLSNGTRITLNNCGLADNSRSAAAIQVVGGSAIMADSVTIVGGYTTSNGGTINATKGVKTYQSATTDPYAGYSVPAFSGCTQNGYTKLYGTGSIGPGVYCNGITLQGGSTVTLTGGLYIIDRGNLTLQGGTTLTASAPSTIVLTSSGATSGIGTVQISNGARFTITAMSTGPLAGVAIFQDRRAATSGTDVLTGGSTVNVTGALYFPTQKLSFSNGSSMGSGCIQLIARTFDFTGGASFGNNCAGVGVRTIGGGALALVE